MKRLSSHFRIRRRYMRSVNLERDMELADSLEGYVLTPRAVETFGRVLEAYATPNITRAWTLTGVYGTGKSAFANFLAALFAPGSSEIRKSAARLLQAQAGAESINKQLEKDVPADGLVPAIVTARREPLTHTVLRGLARGAEEFWSTRRGRKPKAVDEILRFRDQLAEGTPPDLTKMPELAQQVARASGTGLILIIDELGKLLEHAGRTGGADDLFLLQQLAELPAGPAEAPVLVLGLLHQAFSEYGHFLSSAERAEWEKVQGRFEDVPFAESPDQLIRLMAEAIEAELPPKAAQQVRRRLDLAPPIGRSDRTGLRQRAPASGEDTPDLPDPPGSGSRPPLVVHAVRTARPIAFHLFGQHRTERTGAVPRREHVRRRQTAAHEG